MHWLQLLDISLFRSVNQGLQNGFFDVLMPFCSGNALFAPALVALCAVLLWRGGARGRLCVVMVLLAVALGDTLICKTLKDLVARPRPFWDLPNVHIPPGIGKTDSGSMPSSHAANWFAATMVVFIYYRRSLRFMVPAAALVSFSRVYNGVHYPSDVLAGAILGAGYAAGLVWTLDALWNWGGRRWFPLWWERLPSLLNPATGANAAQPQPARSAEELAKIRDTQLLRLGYLLILLLCAVNLIFIGSGKIELSEDEAYQWLWSKHLALSYYSKPPLIAYTQFLGTHLWGDTEFGVRFFSPVISAIGGIFLLGFLARVANARAALIVCVASMTAPLVAGGSVLMTVDPLSVLFWTLAMIAGWRAVRENSTIFDWVWVGIWMGLGFLGKYTELFQLICWVVFFFLWAPARKQLRRPGPYVALLINVLFMLPVFIWNRQHGWITVHHVASNGGLQNHWSPTPANIWFGISHFMRDYLVLEALILNPFFAIPAVWAAIALWRRRPAQPVLIYLFSMGMPVFLIYLLLSIRSRILLNWIAPGVLPLLCLGAVYWEQQLRSGVRWIRKCFVAGVTIGTVAVVLFHDTNLIAKVSGRSLPPKLNPMCRVSGWKETAQMVELAAEGKPVFIIGGHYGITSETVFYLPEAKRCVTDQPLVYYQSESEPANQFYFWPGYQNHKGENAIYVQELELGPPYDTRAIPPELQAEFASIKDLGSFDVLCKGQYVRRIQITECRDLR